MEKERWPLLASFRIAKYIMVSNVGDIPKVDFSYLEPAETLSIEGGQESSALMVEYSDQPEIVGKDFKKHIAISSNPANIPALEYAGLEVLSKSINNALSIECIDVPLYF